MSYNTNRTEVARQLGRFAVQLIPGAITFIDPMGIFISSTFFVASITNSGKLETTLVAVFGAETFRLRVPQPWGLLRKKVSLENAAGKL